MDILKLIKTRCAIRKYTNKPIPKRILNKIIEAGRWGPSIVGIQPSKFIVVTNRRRIKKISRALLKKSKQSKAVINMQLHLASKTIGNAPVIIIACNSGQFAKIGVRCEELYHRFIGILKVAELSAISAANQNMILTAEDLGISSCWLDTPLLCSKEINKIIKNKEEIVSILTFGYPAEKNRRSSRKPLSEVVKYI